MVINVSRCPANRQTVRRGQLVIVLYCRTKTTNLAALGRSLRKLIKRLHSGNQRESPMRTAAPGDPRLLAKTENASKTENDASNCQEKQTCTWKMSETDQAISPATLHARNPHPQKAANKRAGTATEMKTSSARHRRAGMDTRISLPKKRDKTTRGT